MTVRPLRHMLYGMATLLTVLPFLAVTLLGVFWLLPHLRQEIAVQHNQLATAVATQVESYLTTSHLSAASVAGLHINDLDTHNLEHVQHVIETTLTMKSPLQALYLVDREGRVVAVGVPPDHKSQQRDLLGLDLSRNALFQKARQTAQEQWSDTFLSVVGGGLSVALAMPSGSRVVIAEFQLGRLTSFLRQISKIEGQLIFVIDKRGQIIADQSGLYTAQQINLSNIPIVRKAMSGLTVFGNFDFEGKGMVGSIHPVGDIGWSVLVARPQRLAYMQAWNSIGVTSVGLLITSLLAFGIAIFFSRRFAQRFELLAGQARRITEGTPAVDWPRCIIAEIDNLAADLRLMSQTLQQKQLQLEELNTTLEHRVTEELEKNREKDALMIQQGRLAAMGEMMSNIAHQWRQPLNELGLMIQMLRIDFEDQLLDRAKLDEHITAGMQTIQYMSQTIDDFRNFFKQDRTPREFSVEAAIQSALALVQKSMQHAGIKLVVQCSCGCSMMGFPNEFSQMLLNIVNNARDVLLERHIVKPVITISLACIDSATCVTVEDNAGGISPEIIDKIFDPYFTTRHKSRGTGLGLYMARMIVENNLKGQINVINTAAGARFSIVIPCCAHCADQQQGTA